MTRHPLCEDEKMALLERLESLRSEEREVHGRLTRLLEDEGNQRAGQDFDTSYASFLAEYAQ